MDKFLSKASAGKRPSTMECLVRCFDDSDPFKCIEDGLGPGEFRKYTFDIRLPLSAAIRGVHHRVGAPLLLEDCALQLCKDGDYGPYLDLESSLSELHEELDTFQKNRKNSIILRTQLSVRVNAIIEKLSSATGSRLKRALISLKQMFQEDKDLVHEFVHNDGLDCLVRVGAQTDQVYYYYILRALGQIMLYVDGMNGVMAHKPTIQWLYSLTASEYQSTMMTALKLLLVFVEYTVSNCLVLLEAIETIDVSGNVVPWNNLINILGDVNTSDVINAITLINKTLAGICDRSTFYNQIDRLEKLGMRKMIEHYSSNSTTDLNLIKQFYVYILILNHEDGIDKGPTLRDIDSIIPHVLRYSKSTDEISKKKTPYYMDFNFNSHHLSALASERDKGDQFDLTMNAIFAECSEVIRDDKDSELAKQRCHRCRREHQTNLSREQQDPWSVKNADTCHVAPGTSGNQVYTSRLQSRIKNGGLGHTTDIDLIQNKLSSMDMEENCDNKTKRQIFYNNEDKGEEPHVRTNIKNLMQKRQFFYNRNDKGEEPQVRTSIKNITQKLILMPENVFSEDKQLNLGDEMSGVISKAKEGLEKSKSIKNIIRTEISPKTPEIKINNIDFTWESILENIKRPLVLNDLDFGDLGDEYMNNNLSSLVTPGGFPPPPPPPQIVDNISNWAPPPPPKSSDESFTPSNTKTKKTIKLFWREIGYKSMSKTIWDEIQPISIEPQQLEHLFESRTKEPMKTFDIVRNKEVLVLDNKRSNAINISLKKLPNPSVIKNGILKMDSAVLNRENIEKILNLMPSEEETAFIQEAQLANPTLPLGSAEQFLITLSSIPALNARLNLWVFKLDFESIEIEIAEYLMDIKLSIDILTKNITFKRIIATILSIGNFLNNSESKGFFIDYLSKISEVKDTLQRNSLLFHICNIVMDKFEDTTDLYSEVGPVTRAAKVNYADMISNLKRLERDCKLSMTYLKVIIKYDNNINKLKIGEFLYECAERIMILGMIEKRITCKYDKFLLWLGNSPSQTCDKRIEVFSIISEFALEFRTTREKVLEQRARKLSHQERNKTRGKLITDVIPPPPSADHLLTSILNSEANICSRTYSRKRKDKRADKEEGIEEVFNDLLKTKSEHHHVKRQSKRTPVKRCRTRDNVHDDDH